MTAQKYAPERDVYWMQQALRCAERAQAQREVPVGAVLVKDDALIAQGWNLPIQSQDPTAHAEIQTLRQAGKVLSNYRFLGCTLYVTLEPCAMCVGALMHARVERVVFGAYDERFGAMVSAHPLVQQPCFNHRLAWEGGILK